MGASSILVIILLNILLFTEMAIVIFKGGKKQPKDIYIRLINTLIIGGLSWLILPIVYSWVTLLPFVSTWVVTASVALVVKAFTFFANFSILRAIEKALIKIFKSKYKKPIQIKKVNKQVKYRVYKPLSVVLSGLKALAIIIVVSMPLSALDSLSTEIQTTNPTGFVYEITKIGSNLYDYSPIGLLEKHYNIEGTFENVVETFLNTSIIGE